MRDVGIELLFGNRIHKLRIRCHFINVDLFI